MIAQEITVLKFGSSVLTDLSVLPEAVHEVYREVRAGRRVIAVVSAIGETTDRLEREVRALAPEPNEAARAALLATGEAHAVAALTLALDAAGLPAVGLDFRSLGLRLRGPRLDAEPVGVDLVALQAALRDHAVVVVPGFVGTAEDGAPGLLGRGGSDLSAIFLAHASGARRCRLLKDVPGWFTSDPADRETDPRRFATLAWADALSHRAPIVQHKAVACARTWARPFEVAAPGDPRCTVVGAAPTRLAATESPSAPVRVSLLGLGTVGRAVARHLLAAPERYEIVSVLVRDLSRSRDLALAPGVLTDDPRRAASAPADVVIELLGGVEPALELVRRALREGRSVVTANKELIAARGPELERVARDTGASLRHGAAVGGSVPMIEVVEQAAHSAEIVSLRGVINGTTNFVLDRVAAGESLEAAVAEAQQRGLAEADPAADVEGLDAAWKLRILARATLGEELDAAGLTVEGVRGVEARPGDAVPGVRRLVASLRRGPSGPVGKVAVETLSPSDPLYHVRGDGNGLVAVDLEGREHRVFGRGAGGRPTAVAVFADVEDILRRGGRAERSDEIVRPGVAS